MQRGARTVQGACEVSRRPPQQLLRSETAHATVHVHSSAKSSSINMPQGRAITAAASATPALPPLLQIGHLPRDPQLQRHKNQLPNPGTTPVPHVCRAAEGAEAQLAAALCHTSVAAAAAAGHPRTPNPLRRPVPVCMLTVTVHCSWGPQHCTENSELLLPFCPA